DQMQTVLSDEQSALMPRVRQARERARYRSGLSRMVGFLNPASHIDVSALLLDMDMSAAERQAIDPFLSSYESTLTTDAKRLHESASEMILQVLDRLAAQGLGDPAAQQDQQRRGQMFDGFRAVWGEVQQKLQ